MTLRETIIPISARPVGAPYRVLTLTLALSSAAAIYARFAAPDGGGAGGQTFWPFALLVGMLASLVLFRSSHAEARARAAAERSAADLQRSHRELEDSERKFRKLLESAPDALVITDADGHVQYVN